jgi:hypothetical protein
MNEIERADRLIPEPKPDPDEDHPKPDELAVGQWFWVLSKEHDDEWKVVSVWRFACIVELGSNYAKLEAPYHENRHSSRTKSTWRIHFDGFYDKVIWVPNPQEIIDGYLSHHHSRLHLLMGEMKAITARLAIGPQRELHASGSETQALSTTLSGQSYGDYKGALVKAQKEELPAIFEKIKDEHHELATWMSAAIVPMRAEANKLHGITKSIESRIFNVELYAGLVEQIVQVSDGEPASLTTPVTLIQRRHYMDEECLAHYEIGGMRFNHIEKFDRWVAKTENLTRLLPFERCIVAFRVRRYDVERVGGFAGLGDYLQFIEERELDRKTYVYIRNGEQLFRMTTGIDFGPQLFPDIDREVLASASGQKLWARNDHTLIHEIITDHDYKERLKHWNERVARNDARRKEWEERRAKATKEEIAKDYKLQWFSEDDRGVHFDSVDESHFQPFDKTSVYYDDIRKFVDEQIEAHNRIALVLQGLLDRSPCLHPHPPWQIWTMEGFEQALRLIHDDSRALVAGPKPDFEAYRKRINASVRVGSTMIGQHELWLEVEAEKWNRKFPDKKRGRYHPPGNDGPGHIAKVVAFKKASRKVTFEWERESQKGKKFWVPSPKRPGWGHWGRSYAKIKTTFTCGLDELFHFDAYVPGDFKQFFNDPRTRAEYLQWTPFLLAAEEWQAGNERGVPKQPDFKCVHCGEPNPHMTELHGYGSGGTIEECPSCGKHGGYEREIDDEIESLGGRRPRMRPKNPKMPETGVGSDSDPDSDPDTTEGRGGGGGEHGEELDDESEGEEDDDDDEGRDEGDDDDEDSGGVEPDEDDGGDDG